MKKSVLVNMFWLAIIALSFGPAAAVYAPCQQINANLTNNNTTVVYAAYDPSQGGYVNASWDTTLIPYQTQKGQIDSLVVKEGIVAWRGYLTEFIHGKYCVVYSIYDPGRRAWKTKYFLSYELNDCIPFISDGIVTSTFHWDFYEVHLGIMTISTYDPEKGDWQSNEWDIVDNPTDLMTIKDGIYTCRVKLSTYYKAAFGLYDQSKGSWQVGSFIFEPLIAKSTHSISITDATVSITEGSTTYVRGYDSAAGAWYNGPTKVRASFVAFPVQEWGWFWDTSLAATHWAWTFGDGVISSVRSGGYNYNKSGSFNVTQTATGATGTAQFSKTIITDMAPPTGSISINGGAQLTNQSVVTLSLAAADPTGTVTSMRFRELPNDFGPWEAFNTSKYWNLRQGDGVKTVVVEFRDNNLNVSDQYFASITLDKTPPNPCNISINAGAAYTNLDIVQLIFHAEDATSGVAKVMVSNDNQKWLEVPSIFGCTWMLTSGEGHKTVYANFYDKAGNYGSASATIVLDATAPGSCSLVINADAPYTNSREVTLGLSAVDLGSGVQTMRLKQYDNQQETDWGSWIPNAATAPLTLLPGDGRKWVVAQFQDATGNSCLPVNDTILLDTTPPQDGSLAATPGAGKITLSWSGFSDTGSGLKNYLLYFSTAGFTTMASGTKIYEGPDTTFIHNLTISKGLKYYYRVYAQDKANNISAGATAKWRSGGNPLPAIPLLLE